MTVDHGTRPRSDSRESVWYNEAGVGESDSTAALARGNIGQFGTLVDLLNASAYDPDRHDDSDDEDSHESDSGLNTPTTESSSTSAETLETAHPHDFEPSSGDHTRPLPKRGDSFFRGVTKHDNDLGRELIQESIDAVESAIARAQDGDQEDFVEDVGAITTDKTPQEMLATLQEEFGPWKDDSEEFVMQVPGALYRSSVLIKGLIALTSRRLFLYAYIPPPEPSQIIRSGPVMVHTPGLLKRKRKVWVELRSDTATWYSSSTKLYKPLGTARWSLVKRVGDYNPENPLRFCIELNDGRMCQFEFQTAEAAMQWQADVQAAIFTFRATSDKLRMALPLCYVTRTVITPFQPLAERVTLEFDTAINAQETDPKAHINDGDHDGKQLVQFGYLKSHSAFSEKLVEVIEACRSVPRRCDVVPILEIDSPLRQADSEKRQSLQQDSSLAAQFAKTFALADDPSSLWTATNVGLVRTLPVWGAIALSEHFFCFYRHGILVADVLVRIPLVDIDDAVPVRAFGFRIWGLAIQVHGAPDCRLDFMSKKTRDEAIERVKQAVLQVKAADVAISEQSAGADRPVSSNVSSAKGSAVNQPSLSLDTSNLSSSTTSSPASSYVMSPLKPTFGVSADKAVVLGQNLEEEAPMTGVRPMVPLPRIIGVAARRKVTGMHFVCLTIGSRGDVQPYISLGIELKKDGNRVTIASHPEYRKWVESFGIEYKDVGGDPGALMKLSVEHKMFSPGFFKESLGHFREWLDNLFHESWEACQEADVLIESPSTFAGIHVAEALQIPYLRAFTMPWTSTSAYPQAFAAGVDLGPGYNLASYAMFNSIIWKAMSGQVNRWRKNELGIKPTTEKKMKAHKVPFIYNFSAAVVPKPLDWGDHITISGYWFLPHDDRAFLDPSLVDFINRARADNKPIIYVGFGSITVSDAAAVTRAVVRAVQNADVRAILSKGWSERGEKKHEEVPLPDSIFSVQSVAHDLLFPLIDAACHHGGAGTTGASLRAGLPTLIHPFFGDQFFWATRVTKLGAGIRIDTLSEKDMTSAFKRAVTDRILKEKAEDVGKKIRAENGPRKAIEFIYDHMNLALERSTARAARAAGTAVPVDARDVDHALHRTKLMKGGPTSLTRSTSGSRERAGWCGPPSPHRASTLAQDWAPQVSPLDEHRPRPAREKTT